MRPESELPPDPVAWLYGRQILGMTPGLERIRRLLALLGEPQRSFRSVLVGGTNGKGSTARALAACLESAGSATGLFTSPHLSRLGERFVVGGAETPRPDVARALETIIPFAEDTGASFFEVVTAAACLLFARAGVATAVMEVGLGGRFDATNALEPELSIVTGVALDHTELLGGTVEEIAREKAGIFRPGRLALTGGEGGALETLRREATSLGTPLWVLGEAIWASGHVLGWAGIDLSVDCPAGEVSGWSPLVGRHQIRNLALAASAALALGVPQRAVEGGLAAVRWPGRMERIPYRGRWVVFDGAHNPQAARVLGESLDEMGERDWTLVVGVGREKDLAGIAAELGARAASVTATRAANSPRARDPEEVAAAFGPVARAIAEPREALATAVEEAPPGGTVVVAGSLYLVGELRPMVTGEEHEQAERWQ